MELKGFTRGANSSLVHFHRLLRPFALVSATASKLSGIGTGLMRDVHAEFGQNRTISVSDGKQNIYFGRLLNASWHIILVVLQIAK